MPISGLHHADLAVRDVERPLAFYLEILGPLGSREAARYPSYRGTEEVVYLHAGRQTLGLRCARRRRTSLLRRRDRARLLRRAPRRGRRDLRALPPAWGQDPFPAAGGS